MSLKNYLIKKLLHILPTLIGVSIAIFILFHIAGGDPAIILAGKHCTPERIQDIRHQLSLDKPLFLQYLDVLKTFFTFNFGRSWISRQLISNMLWQGGQVSLAITLPGFILTSIISISLSLYAAFYRGEWIDRLLSIVAITLMSISVLSYILFSQRILAYKLGLFPICQYEKGFPNCVPYIILPCIIIIILSIGHDLRFYRTIVLDQIHQDYVRTARAKGLSNFAVLFKHVLKNAMIPIITNLTIQIPSLILGSILIESFFAIPGIGGLLVEAVRNSDFPVIKAITILLSIIYIFFTFIVDLLYVIVDPRVRLE